MKIEEIDSAKMAFIAQCGHQLVWIDNTIYQFTSFVPSSTTAKKHVLKGVNVTQFITQQHLNPINEYQLLNNEMYRLIELGIKETREYHENILWRTWVHK